ncbi:electron transport complex subunit RsxC [Vibrio vulnificus]|uniref:electron transport complex subunit RsxC n=1 Tax=Vibrio vulnificus TaxID=672 RepID=UPI001CDC3DE1|nr:electron transport complex subunit RsxC [Vibrio vulnificus]MCA3983068.1 electron transport complex subunit RsxC [Vibrio vulnificus]MCR9502789.1 electron transport complex subunit RsxC [Vibrio vulnificus]MCU8389737.1 electron transport complex subunit RsxC [Vibrio vulnificus]MCU8548596.1 electron transport complex subunit RsxC [Vibrio vulnificus]MCU8576594.1 electron transport complex subunit RsxC [Vibrio vulnificus]
MLSLIEQIRTGALWDFPGGVHPAENKRQSNQQPLVHAALANEIVLPLKQHIGKPGNILVNVGDHVLKGQLLTQSNAGFTLPIHASTSGTITAIETRTVAHPSGLSEMCVVITPDGQDTWCEKQPVIDYSQQSSDYLLDVIRMAGISGMGGAGFPTAKKIQSGLGRTEILIVNAAECEPYITADDKLLQEHAEEVLQGIEIVEHILQPKLTIIGIEDNKPEAIKALESAAQNRDIVIRVIPTKYPSGGEKQLIKVLTNKEVPAGGIPADIGILVQNVGSLYAIKRAVMDGEPMVNRVVTLTGNTFETPRNVWVPLGTPVHALLEQFGYQADKKLPRLIMGGPMMGFSLPHANVPITKTSNCILAPTRKEISPAGYEMECIRCGACAEACPASLLPQQLQWHAKAEEFDKCEELNLKDCIECGACAFVCPSEIPLVSYYRQAKAEIRTRAQESDAAERAKLRFEEKKARMEREKEERENRFKKAAEDRRKEMKSTGGDDAIAAAIARVKAQKTQDSEQAPSVKPAVAAAIAKAKAKQAAAADSGSSEPDNSEMVKLREERKRLARERKAEKEQSKTPDSEEQGDKKSAVAAAIARAKAKKAQQPPLASSESSADEPEDKKAAVAAAIARAKARKAQQTDEPTPEQNREESQAAEDDPKKAAVAAAIARAKARKAQQTDESAPEKNREESQAAEDDPKKAAVAAAIARAKARKAQQTDESAPEQNHEESQPADDDPKKAAVAAAIARAKARKAQQTDEPAPEQNREELQPTEDDPKKAAVAAAIARAKARKAQQTSEPAPEQNHEESQPAEDDPKKAAVAAAIARAKARKAQQTDEPAPEQNREESQPAEDDPKKAAVAAAIARAKARKAQQTSEPAPEQNREESQAAEDAPKKAAVAAAIARAKARKAQQAEQKQNTEENE